MDGCIDFSPLDANSAILSDDEMERVKKTIDLVEADIQRLDTEIARLQRERDAHAQHLIRLRAARSSISKLPSELLSKILAASVQHDATLFTLPYMKSYIPWVARQISGRWRNASMRDIGLWNHIRHSPPPRKSSRWMMDDVQQAWECLLDCARGIIPMTGPVYLYLQLSMDGQSLVSQRFYTGHTIELLHSLGDRLKGLDLSADVIAFHAYQLRDDTMIFGSNQPSAILNAHSLRTLRILSKQKLHFRRSFLHSLRWPQLTEIVIEYPVCARTSTNTLLNCLAQCSSLERATLKVFGNKFNRLYTSKASQESEYTDYDTEDSDVAFETGWDDPSSYPGGRLCTLPRLTSLKLSISPSLQIEFLGYLRVPKLSYFLVTHAGRPYQYDVFMEEVAHFLTFSACPLRTFIENTKPSAIDYEEPPSLENFLASLSPTLEELHTCMVIDGSTMHKIADAKLLPKLRALKFCVNSEMPYEALNILEKRLGSPSLDDNSCTSIRKIRMVYPFDTENNPIITREERSKIENFRREKEAKYRGLELYFGPKGFTTWTDTQF